MYVDAFYDRKKDKIRVVDRVDGVRVFKDINPAHTFYYEHPSGGSKTIFGDAVKKYTTNSQRKYDKELAIVRGKNRRIFESDINPVFRALADHYSGLPSPNLNVSFWDIEVGFDPDKGFAPVTDPFNPVTAITVYHKWLDKLITLALRPPTMTMAEAEAACDGLADTFIYDDERQLLDAFLTVIEDTDVLSGYNCEGFDRPYIVNRIKAICPNANEMLRRLSLWDQLPREKEINKFGKTAITFEFVGRVALDYLLLYQKHNTQQLHSYRLDFVGEIEVGENKVPYEGTLDQLYRDDFRKFIDYNRQDVMLLAKIDEKKRFIELANQVAHANCVLLKTTMGSVALVEQAIINEMHALGLVSPNRKERVKALFSEDEEDEEHIPVVGAYVAKPKVGVHDWVGCVDINSLYPSTLRALNASPETIIGQFRADETDAYIAQKIAAGCSGADAWEGLFHTLEYGHIINKTDTLLTLEYDDGRPPRTMSGRDWYDHIFDPANKMCVSANGTVFRTDQDGIIPLVLGKWYAERKELQKKEARFADLLDTMQFDEAAITFLEEEGVSHTDPNIKAILAEKQKFYNSRQQARKILLNSLYGALLNEVMRFYDARLGKTTTLTGRSIVRHMTCKINEIVSGEYKIDGKSICYNDTDSCYYSPYEALKDEPEFAGFEWTTENILSLYDGIADETNASFADFMMSSFNTSRKRGEIIRAGRELLGSKALFIKKKKYAILMVEKEGHRLDKNGKPGKLKVMGLDLKRADTPKYMQQFLEKMLMDILTGADRDKIFDDIRKFRKEFKSKPGWDKGTPKKVNAMSAFADKENALVRRKVTTAFKKGETGKVNMPGHVRAAINWNRMLKVHNDKYSIPITDNTKTIVCKLKPNVLKMDSIAYPIDQLFLPDWFKELPFDHALMESTIIDNKIENVVGVLEWDLSKTKERGGEEFIIF